jgi:hypothetical protein
MSDFDEQARRQQGRQRQKQASATVMAMLTASVTRQLDTLLALEQELARSSPEQKWAVFEDMLGMLTYVLKDAARRRLSEVTGLHYAEVADADAQLAALDYLREMALWSADYYERPDSAS